jgi:hypothetical protein
MIFNLPRLTHLQEFDFRNILTPLDIRKKTYHTGRRWKFQDTNCWAQLIHTGRYHISIAHRFNWYFDLSFRSVIICNKIKNLVIFKNLVFFNQWAILISANCWVQLIHSGRYHISIAHRFNRYFDLSFRSVIIYKKIRNLS